MGGEERARAADRSGQIWANAIGNIGNTVAGVVQQHQEQQAEQKKQAELAKRDAYVAQTISQWDGQDHQALAAKLVTALGPVEGVKMATNISAFSKSAGEKDPEKHLTGTVAGLRLIDSQSDEAVAANWQKAKPIFQQTLDQAGVGVQLPDQWDPSLRPTLKTLQGTFEQKLGFKPETPAKVGTHVVGGNLVDDSGKVLFTVEAKPEKTMEEKAREAFMESRARAQGTASVKPPAEPLDVSADLQTTATGRKFINLSDYKGTNAGNAAKKAAESQGAVALSKEDAGVLQEIDAARSNTSDITSQIEGKLATSPLGRLEKAGENKLSALFQTDDDLAAYGAWRTAAIKNLRATAGSKGLRLNQAEIELAIQNDIPQLTDTVSVAKKKAQILNTMFDNAEKAVFGGRGAASAPKAPPTVHSQAEVDALPAGTTFIDSTDGKKYKKGS